MNPFTNRRIAEWLKLCADFGLSEDFERVFGDDKRETDLDHPRYIEQLLDDDMEAE